MTDILCSWLNGELKVSSKVDVPGFARAFANGYLIGEVLSQYNLQDDFDQFSQNTSANSKLNNFTRLEPTLHLLEVPFDTNIARDIMTEKYGVATRLMYQLFIALNKKQKSNLTGVAIETMRAAAPVKLEGVERIMYKERLKTMTPRQTDLNLDALVARFHEKQITMEATAFKERFEDEERHMQDLLQQRAGLMARHKESQNQKADMLAKISSSNSDSTTTSRKSTATNRAATVHIPKPPSSRTAKAIGQRKEIRRRLEAADMEEDIEVFEERMKRTLPPSKPIGESPSMDSPESKAVMPDNIDLIRPTSNGDYINKIRCRLNEDASARAEREKRRRKVLVDQLQSHEAQEEARREEMLVNRLMRQSQQERRIAVQLLHTRHEKEVIRKNRLIREKQYEERRLREFEEALNREAEMARLAKLDYIEQTKKDQELHDKIAAERAEERYRKHYAICMDELLNIVDFTTKTGEYRELTNKLVPDKLMREWTSLFVSGQPLYTEPPAGEEPDPSVQSVIEEERNKLLDEGDFNEYRNMTGNWLPPEDSGVTGPPRNNPIVGYIVQRLFNIVHPPEAPVMAPQFPPFPIKACVLGKVFAGKSIAVNRLAQNHRLKVLSSSALLNEALEAHKNNETSDDPEYLAGASSASLAATPSRMMDIGQTPAPQALTPAVTPNIPDNRDLEENEKDEGKEKSDPEKPVPAEESATAKNPSGPPTRTSSVALSATGKKGSRMQSSKPRPTARAKLGLKAMKFLKKGKPVDDALTVEILVEAIRRVPEDTGWILDGFPATYNQAKVLEKALSGIDPDGKDRSKSKQRMSTLAPDPRPEQPAPDPPSGINVVIVLDIDDELCLKRSAGRSHAPQTNMHYQQEFCPPPEGSATGIMGMEKVQSVTDQAHEMEQIQFRLTAFQEAWPKLEKWYLKFGSLQKVDATMDSDAVYYEMEKILEDTVKKLQGKDVEDSLPVETETKAEEEKPPEPEPKHQETTTEQPKEEEVSRSRPVSKKGSRSGSRTSAKADKSKSPGRSSSKADKKSVKDSRGPSPKSPKRSRSGKKTKTPEPEPEAEPEAPPGTPPPAPGSDEWEYVNQPLQQEELEEDSGSEFFIDNFNDPFMKEMATILAPQWNVVEQTYISNSKRMFRKMREEREDIVRHFYRIRKDFLEYLRRPDHKQEFVDQWQKQYNELPDDLRDDEEMRSELHQTLDDLRERLWSICDERKEQAEKERGDVMNEGWLDDRLGLMSNFFITVMQGEVDRFQDTVRLLKDYYRGMEGKIPDEIAEELARVPLIELPVEERPGSAKSGTSETQGAPASGAPFQGSRPTTPNSASPSKSATPSGKRKKGAEATTPVAEQPAEAEAEKRPRIPLVPRRPVSPSADAAAAKGGKADKAKGKDKGGKPETGETPPPPADPDSRLLFDAHQTGLTAVDKIIAAEQAAREAEEEAERQREMEKEKEKAAAAAAQKKGAKGKKGGKSRSPSPKKGKDKESASQGTPPPQEEETEEDKEMKQLKEKAKLEFFAAIEEEALAARNRLDLVKVIGTHVLNMLKGKAEDAYQDMMDWLGARFLKEMESIDHMSEIMRNAIESGIRLKEQLLIDQEEFLINEDFFVPPFDKNIKVLRTPTPPPRPLPVEPAHLDTFTVDQIHNIYSQFALTAPTGVLSVKAFQETFVDLSCLTHGSEQLPDMWTTISQDPDKLEMMGLQLSPDGEYIDWRAFLLAASQPLPIPSQADLLQALSKFKDMDQRDSGYVTLQQYEKVDLWFGAISKPISPENPAEPYPYDRLANLKEAFFEIFADHSMEPPHLDYVQMLLYFSVVDDPYEGFLRALSVASGTHMPRLPGPQEVAAKVSSRPMSQASLAPSMDMEAAELDVLTTEEVPHAAMNAKVPLDALDKVLHHGQSQRGDSHRFSVTADPEDAFSRERLAGVYQELGSEENEPVLFSVLIEHPIIQDIVSTLSTYKTIDLQGILANPTADVVETHSVKTTE